MSTKIRKPPLAWVPPPPRRPDLGPAFRRGSLGRPQERRWIGRFAGFTLLALAGAGILLALKQDVARLFELREVRVLGADAVGEEECLQLADLAPGQSLWSIDGQAVAQRLEADPRIRQADVVLEWPAKVVLRLEERQPLARVQGFGFIDETGTLWQRDRRAAQFDLPLITSLERTPEATRGATLVEAARLLSEAERLLPSMSVSQLELAESGPILFFEGGPGPVTIGYQDYSVKLTRLGRLLASYPQVLRQPMDLRWHGRVIVSGMGERGGDSP